MKKTKTSAILRNVILSLLEENEETHEELEVYQFTKQESRMLILVARMLHVLMFFAVVAIFLAILPLTISLIRFFGVSGVQTP